MEQTYMGNGMPQPEETAMQRLKMVSKLPTRLKQPQKEQMKMSKKIPVFILIFTGYLCNNMDVAAETTLSYTSSPDFKVTKATPLSHTASSTFKDTKATPLSHTVLPAFKDTKATPLSHTVSPASEVKDPNLETTTSEDNVLPEEKRLSTLLVAGISISFVFLFILVIVGVWYVWKKAKGRSSEINSVPSGEPGVSLINISTHE